MYDVDEIPQHLYLHPLAVNDPEKGRTFGVAYVWSSPDHDAGMAFLPKIGALAKMIGHTVAPISVRAWMSVIEQVCPYGKYPLAIDSEGRDRRSFDSFLVMARAWVG